MSAPFRPCVAAQPGYAPGEQPAANAQVIKLNTNENPYPPSPRAVAAMRAELDAGDTPGDHLRRYPDPSARIIREAAAAVEEFDADRILVGNGSDELLVVLLRAFVGDGDAVAFPYPTYVLYDSLARLHGAQVHTVDFGPEFALPDALADTGAKLIFVANPNSPSGTGYSPDVLRALARNAPNSIVVVDEAYGAFADTNAMALARTEPNVVVLRTLSKSHGLAGIRVGMLFGSTDIVQGLSKVRDSYSVDRLAIAGGAAALEDTAWTADVVSKICATRQLLIDGMTELGFEPLPSQANFAFVRMGSAERAEDAYRYLKKHAVLVRYFPLRLLDDGIRITVGTDDEIDALLSTLKMWY